VRPWASEAPLLLATRSSHKASEIRQILGARIELVSLEDAGIEMSPVEYDIEAFDTFRENALAKAVHFHERSGLPVIADDSGICAEALGGRPGVRSRRFSGRVDLDGADLDLANNLALIEALADVNDADRTVRYVCAAALVRARSAAICTIGTAHGRLLAEPRGAGGFGYDPHFLLPGPGLTFAELDAPAKHRHSHRAIAFRALAVALR
jgi:XTP/dITP diphosphohydrolase